MLRLIRARGRATARRIRQHRRMLASRRSLSGAAVCPMLSKTTKATLASKHKRVREIEKTFAYFNLDAGNADDWPRVREHVAPDLGRGRNRGRPKGSRKWTAARVVDLMFDAVVNKPAITAEGIARELKKSSKYKDCGTATSIREQIPQARRLRQSLAENAEFEALLIAKAQKLYDATGIKAPGAKFEVVESQRWLPGRRIR